jgi:murein L,D-transpeptidase YcbB/YkuD
MPADRARYSRPFTLGPKARPEAAPVVQRNQASLAVIAAVLGASLGATPVFANTVLPSAVVVGEEQPTPVSGSTAATDAAQAEPAASDLPVDAPAATAETEKAPMPEAGKSVPVDAAGTGPAAAEDATDASSASEVAYAAPEMPQADPAFAAAVETLLAEGLSDQDSGLPFVSSARREAVAAVYAQRQFVPLWSDGGAVSDAARGLVERLGEASRDGLSPDDYALPADVLPVSGPLSADQAARFDVLLSLALVEYADHAQAGRVDPSSLSRNITASPVHPDPATALAAISGAQDPVAALDAFNPPHPGFQALRRKLAELTSPDAAAKLPPKVPAGKTLKKGMRDPRVAVLRERLGLKSEPVAKLPDAEETASADTSAAAEPQASGSGEGAETAGGFDPEVFDETVKEAVSAFQEENGLHADGIVGPRTLLALNAVADDGMAVSDVIANMERWRWMPRDPGQFHVLVNIPEFKARLIRDGKQVYETRVVVGKPSNQTPVFSDEIDHLIVNPYWNVPYSIASQELLPAVRANSSYLSKRNYEVVTGGRVVDPSAIDWSGVNLRTVRIRQRPGRGNALGNIKFMFPNRHSVYLHDTPSKRLFGRSSRAFSHGCVRVQDPFAFADALLQLDPDWNASRLKAMVGGSEKRVNLSSHIPVHLAYFTAFVDENGNLQRRPDIYGHNATLTKALGVEGWQDWQKFAVHVPRATRAPTTAATRPKRQKKEARSLREQRDQLMLRRMRASSDLYR